LADTGDYPGKDEITQGLTLISPLLADKESRKFIERFNTLKKDLLDVADHFHDLEHFYDHQKPTWEKLRQAHGRFQLNRLELEKHPQSAQPLRRIHEILNSKSPYALIRESESLIQAVESLNTTLLQARREETLIRIDSRIARVQQDLQEAAAATALQEKCLGPLQRLRERVQQEASLAHLAQMEQEAVSLSDQAVSALHQSIAPAKPVARVKGPGDPQEVAETTAVKVRPRSVIHVAALAEGRDIETEAAAHAFLTRLQEQIISALNTGARVEIR
jgi:hypothetical protein